jgi:hypothetical protein
MVGLFKLDVDVLPHCYNIIPSESVVEMFQSHPDYKINVYEGIDFHETYTACYDEIKPEPSDEDKQAFDLYRTAVFAKTALDKGDKKVLTFRAVGNQLRVYIMSRKTQGIYLFTQLETIILPDSIEIFDAIIGYLNVMFRLSLRFRRYCKGYRLFILLEAETWFFGSIL